MKIYCINGGNYEKHPSLATLTFCIDYNRNWIYNFASQGFYKNTGGRRMIFIKKLTVKDVMSVQGLGSQDRTTYFYDTKEIGVVVQCGCFYGTEKAFKKQVKKTHGTNQYAKEYLNMLKVVKIRFSRGEE